MIDWSGVGGYVFEWTFAIGELAFAVLGAGLVGGIFGSFVDVALSFIGDRWAGYGRMGGWTLGALSTAIGVPLGWSRGNGKKWSLPSTRKLRKAIATGTRKRRKNASRDFRGLGDVLQGGAALGLIGGVLGFVLGGLLVMGWFSLAMSPFATVDWFEALEFQSAREFHDNTFRRHADRDGIVVATDQRTPWQLFFSPVLILGVAGAVFGTAYGAVQYVEYLVNVPADARERQRRKERQPVVEERQATAAAIEQRLEPLASPPRSVPLKIRWKLLGDGVGYGMLIGAIFFIAGVTASVLLFLGWRSDPAKFPLVAVTFGAIFIFIGALFSIGSSRAWRNNVKILRYGYLARCRIVTCQHPQAGNWKSYAALLEELRAAWDKPIADSNTQADTRSMQRFGTLFWIASLIVFGFMGVVGVGLTAVLVYAAVVQGELVGWLGLAFLAFWWFFIVAMAKLFRRQIRLATTIEKQSLKTLGIEPVVDCRIEFALPDGTTIDTTSKLNLIRRLGSGPSEPDDVLVYDPWKPSNALLLSSFSPALTIGDTGQWRFETPAQRGHAAKQATSRS